MSLIHQRLMLLVGALPEDMHAHGHSVAELIEAELTEKGTALDAAREEAQRLRAQWQSSLVSLRSGDLERQLATAVGALGAARLATSEAAQQRDDARAERDALRGELRAVLAERDAAMSLLTRQRDEARTGCTLARQEATAAWAKRDRLAARLDLSLRAWESAGAHGEAVIDARAEVERVVAAQAKAVALFEKVVLDLTAERDALTAEVAEYRRRIESTPPWPPDHGEPMTDEQMRALKARWSCGSEQYQADADALIATTLAARAEVERLTREREAWRAGMAAERDRLAAALAEVNRLAARADAAVREYHAAKAQEAAALRFAQQADTRLADANRGAARLSAEMARLRSLPVIETCGDCARCYPASHETQADTRPATCSGTAPEHLSTDRTAAPPSWCPLRKAGDR